MKKRSLAVLLSLVMSVGLLAGCGSSDGKESTQSKEQSIGQKTESSAAESSQETEDTAWKEVAAKVDIPVIIKDDPEHMGWMDTTSPITLSVFYGRLTGDYDAWGETVIQQKITELTGVTIDATIPATAEGNELTLMIASGDPLPDIINGINVSSVQYADLVESGSVYDLRELIEKYCPEMWDNMDSFIRDSALDEEGHLYHLPQQASSNGDYMIANGWIAVRGDVCEYFGIEPASITTLSDMEELLELFMENRDLWPEIEYPIFFSGLNSYETSANGRPFYNCFGGLLHYNGGLDMIYDKEADSVHYWLEDDCGYQTLKYMWSLAQKGYVTEASFGAEGIYDEVLAGSALIAGGTNMWFTNYANRNTLPEVREGAYYEKIHLLSAEEGQDVGYSYSQYNKGVGYGVVITKDCSDPERAIKFLEFLDSEYGNLLVTAGIYGEDWVEDTDEYGIAIKRLVTTEERTARGINNSNVDWFNLDSTYNFLDQYANGNEFQREVPQRDFGYDTYSAAPSSVMDSEMADSEYAILRTRLEEIMKNYQTQMIIAEDEEAFEKLYQECLDVINANGLDKLKEYVLGLTKTYITEMESIGAVFQ